jgi:MYXO-CTERM domain-containing protein
MRQLVLGVAAASVALAPASAYAFCRTTTEDPIASVSCPETCQTAGLPLYWPTRHVDYSLNEDGFPGISDRQLRMVFAGAFGEWETAECDGEPVPLVIEQLKGSTSLRVGPLEAEPNDNVLVYIPSDVWKDDRRAFAITKIWYNKRTGHILGADMEFNGGMDPWGVCPVPQGCHDADMVDIANVATHEAGHFLGLAHTDVPEATMWCDAETGEVDKRSLAPDDELGVCAVYGPNAVPDPSAVALTKHSQSGACASAGPPSPTSWLLAIWGLCIAALVRRRHVKR